MKTETRRTAYEVRGSLRSWRPATHWQVALGIVVVTRVVFIAVANLAAWLLADSVGGLEGGGLGLFMRWDAELLRRIAEFGYTDPAGDGNATAFFPFFPVVLRAVHFLGFSYPVAGVLITTAATVVAAAYLHRLAEEELGQGAGRRAVLYLTLFPTAVFLVAPYSESLFIAGAITAFYYARRGRWHLVALPLAVATATRAAGLFLLFGLVLEFARQRDLSRDRILKAFFAAVCGLIPIVLFCTYLYFVKDDPFHFFVAQREGWQRSFTMPWTSLSTTWEMSMSAGAPTNWVLSWRLEILAAAAGLFFTGWALKQREWGYAGYMAATLGALMMSTWYFSIPRMLLSLFPIMLFLASATGGEERRHEYAILILAPLATLGVVVFTRGIWFF